MYRKGEVSYEPLPLPDKVQMGEADAVAAAEAFRSYMRKRHSVRHYDTRPVPEAVITACIEAAATAPSGANHQPWHFVAISDPEMRRGYVPPPRRRRRISTPAEAVTNGCQPWSRSGPGPASRT